MRGIEKARIMAVIKHMITQCGDYEEICRDQNEHEIAAWLHEAKTDLYLAFKCAKGKSTIQEIR